MNIIEDLKNLEARIKSTSDSEPFSE